MTYTEPLSLSNWRKVVGLIQVALWEVFLEEESMWQAVVLIYKGRWDYRGIVKMEVVWKVVTVILNLCPTTSIAFHGVLLGFREDCRTRTIRQSFYYG